MKIHFFKYQGTGNDFVLLDNRVGEYDELTLEQIRIICSRRFGVGADGLIRLNTKPDVDFELDYFNADGSKSFCGNGARCGVAFAKQLGMHTESVKFLGIDGIHYASLQDDLIQLEMHDVSEVKLHEKDYEIHTGSPHYIRFVENLKNENIVDFGKKIRYSDAYSKDGINVNLVEVSGENELTMLTYERGVENETYSCGTGATAVAIAYALKNELEGGCKINIQVKGGKLRVEFSLFGERAKHVQLIGPATFIFEGEIDA